MRFDSENFTLGRLARPDGERVAVLNWQSTPQRVVIPLRGPGPYRVTELWTRTDLGTHRESVELPQVPGHSGRLLHLRPE